MTNARTLRLKITYEEFSHVLLGHLIKKENRWSSGRLGWPPHDDPLEGRPALAPEAETYCDSPLPIGLNLHFEIFKDIFNGFYVRLILQDASVYT